MSCKNSPNGKHFYEVKKKEPNGTLHSVCKYCEEPLLSTFTSTLLLEDPGAPDRYINTLNGE